MNEITSGGSLEIKARCPNCGTLYRVDGTRLARERTRARCAVCKGVLMVSRPRPPSTRQGTDELNSAVPERDGRLAIERVLLALLEGQRERRETMWRMVREVFRLGEAVEKHHALLNRAVQNIVTGPGDRGPQENGAVYDDADLETLRHALEEEKELVHRLRRARVDIERRAVEAESRLNKLEARKRESLIAELTSARR